MNDAETLREAIGCLPYSEDSACWDLVKPAIEALDRFELLRKKLTAHHAMHRLSEETIKEWSRSNANVCPVCARVEAGAE